MTGTSKLLSEFRLNYENLATDPAIGQAYNAYSDRRDEFGAARKALNEATKNLHELLDAPLRASGHIPEGKSWTLTEPDKELGLIIQVWSAPKQRGRRKPEIPLQQLSFAKTSTAA